MIRSEFGTTNKKGGPAPLREKKLAGIFDLAGTGGEELECTMVAAVVAILVVQS
jgi:hypothetical protein